MTNILERILWMFEHLRVSERGGGDGGGVDEDDEGLRSMLSALKACWPGAHGLIVATSARQVGGEVPRHVRVPARPRGGISRTIGSRFTCLSIVSSLSIARSVSLSNKFRRRLRALTQRWRRRQALAQRWSHLVMSKMCYMDAQCARRLEQLHFLVEHFFQLLEHVVEQV